MVWSIHVAADRMKVLVMVSNFGHCLNDLLYRWRIGALPVDIVGVVSNHLTYQKVVVNHDLPFHHIKVTAANKTEAEARLMTVVEESGAELVVLSRAIFRSCRMRSARPCPAGSSISIIPFSHRSREPTLTARRMSVGSS